MNPLQAYRQQRALGWTRIDMLLALYTKAVDRTEAALTALRNNDRAAKSLLTKAALLVNGLASGVDASQGELPLNILRLYEFVLHSFRSADADQVAAALDVLRTLHKGFNGIREEAVQLERSNVIPRVDAPCLTASRV
jgi:flagellar secretion chaperone FliS